MELIFLYWIALNLQQNKNFKIYFFPNLGVGLFLKNNMKNIQI